MVSRWPRKTIEDHLISTGKTADNELNDSLSAACGRGAVDVALEVELHRAHLAQLAGAHAHLAAVAEAEIAN